MTQTVETPQRSTLDSDVAIYDARELIMNGVKAEIQLDDQTYTLRITRAGKLILTK